MGDDGATVDNKPLRLRTAVGTQEVVALPFRYQKNGESVPNISKERFDKMNMDLEDLHHRLEASRAENLVLALQQNNFDEILAKISRAANGVPLVSRGNDHALVGMSYNGNNYDEGHRCTPPTTEEVQRQEIFGLQDRMRILESRLSAVDAIAVFAQSHKA